MVQPQQPAPTPQVKLTVKVTLQDIYDCLCPACKEQLLGLFESKARGAAAGALRQQLEAPAAAEPPAPEPEPPPQP